MAVYYGLALFSPPRSIGGIVANITLMEEGIDTYTITEHPVEVSSGGINGAISDHMYRNPAILVIRAGWSNSRPEALVETAVSLVTGLFNGGNFGQLPSFNLNYAASIYQQLLALQASRVPFEILTGKRVYENMVIRSLRQTTDEHSENALLTELICQEILTVTTSTVTTPDPSQSTMPQKTSIAQDRANLTAFAAGNFSSVGLP